MQIGPDTWGPHGWKFIHFLALAYPNEPTDEQKKNYKTFFEALQPVLPCSLCANNYKRHITEELPITEAVLKDKESFVKWSIDMHNLVNKETGKLPLSYDDALNLIYNNFETKQVKFDKQSTSVPVSTPSKTKDTNIEFKKSKVVQDDDNSFGYFSLLIIIFVILVTIAIVYKKQ
jgi:hypothetical protein